MKRTLVLIILLVPLCACIGDGNDSAPSISDRYPTEDELYLTPYEEVSFFIEASDPDGDYEEIRWYVDDEFIQYGNDFTYSFEDEKEYEIRAVVDDGKFNTASVWKAEVEIDIEQIMEEISSLRGLEFTGNVPFRRISREDLNTMLEEEFASMEDGLLIDEKVMRAFYVWNGDSLADEVLLLYSTGVEGYYDMVEKEFVLVDEDSKNPAVRMVTLAHELVHVLQDQYYDTASMLDTLNDDEYIALTSLFEGEATYFESYYLYGMDEDAITDYFLYYNSIQDIQVEPIISDLVMFPYLEGFNFILEIIADNGIGYLDTVYNNPPETTEQIMHPEKYYSGELGVEVGAIEVEGMELIDENVLGESNIYIFLDQYLGTQDAEAGADGWNGDIYSYYERDEDHLLIFRSMWDDDQNAEEFMEMYTSFLQATPAGPFTIIEDTPERCIMESESGTVAITLDSNEVVVLSSNDADIVMELL